MDLCEPRLFSQAGRPTLRPICYQDEASATAPSAVLHLQGSVPSFSESAALWRNFSAPVMWLQLSHSHGQQILGPSGCSGGGSVDRPPVITDTKPRCLQLLGHTGARDKTVHSSLLQLNMQFSTLFDVKCFTVNFRYRYLWASVI